MKIKDIVNREIVNLTNCESEPIHIPGSIQPHGFLIGISPQTGLIDFCSSNSSVYSGISPESLLGKSLDDFFGSDQNARFGAFLQKNEGNFSKPYVFSIHDTDFNTTIHRSGETLILELEPVPDVTPDLPDIYNQTRGFLSLMEKHSYLPELCLDIADETRAITGYDRVMIYRFDEEYNGEVIAESKREDLVSFANQKYPHTDIPVQARELYIKNPLRIITDVNYQPVPLLTLDDAGTKSNKSLDLSLSVLRSVSPIHIEYLKNMGVGATLTVSLLKDNKLWGLIACHHYSPKVLPHYVRLSVLLHGNLLTSQIGVREVSEEFEIGQAADKALMESLALLNANENFIGEDHKANSLLDLANATGLAIYYNGQIFKSGVLPENEDLLSLMHDLSEKYPTSSIHTEQLVTLFPEREHLSKFAAGIVYHSITGGDHDGILWVRSERRETINWAGNPNKAVVVNESGAVRLSPRKSFELWLEEVKNKSQKWRKSEINTTSSFAYALQKHVNLRYVKQQETRNRIMNEELTAANKELANLNWISTHDLKEPLRKIQIFASKVLDKENPDLSSQVKDSVGRMRIAAEKMQMLIDDILEYSKTGTMERVYELADFDYILTRVLADLSDTIEEKGAVINRDDLPSLKIIPFQIHQLFVNLLSNALKFSKDQIVPEITVTVKVIDKADMPSGKLHMEPHYYEIAFRDNGIGFEKEYEKRIFDVFQRLHPSHKYPGTGIGLAICKKIMENHGGIIVANSDLGEGSVFKTYFPVED